MNRRGSVLILVLWTVAFIAFLAVTLSGKVRQNAFFYQKLDERERIRLASEAGIKSAVDRLRVRESGALYSLAESAGLARMMSGELNQVIFKLTVPVVNRDEAQQKQALSSEYGQNYTEFNESGQELTTTYGIMDENRKININRADRFLFIRLLSAVGLKDEDAAGLAGQIIDYRDSDDNVTATIGVGGSEESRYHAAGLDYAPKNNDFEFVSELLRVPGMTTDIYQRMRRHLTVLGDGAVNLNTAGPEVLSLVDLHPGVVNKMLTLRAGPDGEQGTEDDIVFQSQDQIGTLLKQTYGLKLQEQLSLKHAFARRLVTLSSNYFSAVSVAAVKQSRGQTLAVYGSRRGIQRWMEYS
ncbi:MAG: general secretion pathway protein GspK [Candidatus Omnitrophica bacterium]|jgi:type II secretory pathway component PulK|nr:general secretion pathway protein GspK [Candidatus Omnitrophota bacterium]